jgi:hypothetical protein
LNAGKPLAFSLESYLPSLCISHVITPERGREINLTIVAVKLEEHEELKQHLLWEHNLNERFSRGLLQ